MALRCFAQYPRDIGDYIKSTFPEGYTKERTSNFEGDGKYTSRHVITYENGVIYNRVTLTGAGFREEGNILGKKLADIEKPICSMYFPGKDGLRAEVCKVSFPLSNENFTHSRRFAFFSRNSRNQIFSPDCGNYRKTDQKRRIRCWNTKF